MFTADDTSVFTMVSNEFSTVVHEEADTKIVFYAYQGVQESNVALRCCDTKVLIIMLGNVKFLQDNVKV